MFTAARVVALVAWLVAASEPPRSAAIVVQVAPSPPNTAAASAAPAGIRISVWSASQSVSAPGILSTKNSAANMTALAPISHGLSSTWSPPGRSTQPSAPAAPVRNSTE